METLSTKRHVFSQRLSLSWTRLRCLVFTVAVSSTLSLPPSQSTAAAPTYNLFRQDDLVADENPSNPQALSHQVRQLVVRLGDEDYTVRSEAESELRKIGGAAIEPLRRAIYHEDGNQPDSEIQLRATRLLILIERKERERKIRGFLEGTSNELDLPGWPEFSSIAGRDKLARKLFVDMHQAQPELLAAVNSDRRQVEEIYQRVARQYLRASARSNASHSLSTAVAMLFVSAIEFDSGPTSRSSRIAVSDIDLNRLTTFLNQPQMVMVVNSSGNRTQLHRLILNWLASLPKNQTSHINQQISVTGTYELKNNIGQMIEFASNTELPTQTRFASIEVVGQIGSPDDADQLAAIFDDKTVLGSYLVRSDNLSSDFGARNSSDPAENGRDRHHLELMQVQMRDLALATAVRLSNYDLKDFGFDHHCFDGNKLLRNRAGFVAESDRDAAFATWKQRKQAN